MTTQEQVDHSGGDGNDGDTGPLNGTVEGSSGNDFIDFNYLGDPEGDRVDHDDAILPGAAPSDDLIYAFDGNDIVGGGYADDEIYGGTGNDTLGGGEGNDTIFGEDGNDKIKAESGDDSGYGGIGDDTLLGGEGNDTLSGGDGNDTIFGGDDKDILIVDGDDISADGGAGGEDYDVLDLRGLPPYRIEDMVPDSNGNGFNGTVVYLDPDGNPTGESMPFTEIEKILENDPPMGKLDGTVEGTAGDDLIDLAYTGDPEGDKIDNNDALLPGAVGNDDLVYAFGGSDTVYALDGDDEVFGGSGNDIVYGGVGDDTLTGDAGDDQLVGEAGNDTLQGGDGNDGFVGGGGSDTAYGGDGGDTINTGNSQFLFDNPYPPLPVDPDPFNDRDVVYGGDGNDTILTGDDADTIFGDAGDDTIDAGIDNDSVQGGVGNDTIIGGEGSDRINGNGGDDVIYGGLGPSFPDSLNIPDVYGDLVTDNGDDVISAGSGNDTIFGLDDNDIISGGADDDTIDAGVDDDVVRGDSGNDTINGGQGEDELSGGDDRDTFTVSNGTDGAGDTVFGGSGGDDFDTLQLTTAGLFRIVDTSIDSDGNGIDGTVEFLDTDGNVTGSMTFENIEQIIPCFTPGTMIATPRGERPVDDLRIGDRIITRDNGIQEIRWVGHKEITGRMLVNAPHLRPVLIKAGSLGNGLTEIRGKLAAWEEDWNAPGMEVYDRP